MPVVKEKKQNPQQRQKKPEVRHDRPMMEPGEYEVTDDSIFSIRVPLCAREESGGKVLWSVVDESDSDVVEEVDFRMWSYDEMVEMRKMATKYDQLRRVHMIDHDILNRLKIQRLMVAWTFDKTNERLALFHSNGVLVDECWDKVKRLQPNILTYIIQKMNEYYE